MTEHVWGQRTPAGLTSSVKAEDESFILQTEFLIVVPDPEEPSAISGKIVTTVAVGGRVVQKVERAYLEPIDTEEDFISAEQAVKKQHLSMVRRVTARSRDLVGSEITITPEDRVRLVPGVQDVRKIDFSQAASKHDDSASPMAGLNSQLLRNLLLMIIQNTRLGKLQKAVGTADNCRFVLTGLGGNTYLVDLKSDADVSAVLGELDRIKSK